MKKQLLLNAGLTRDELIAVRLIKNDIINYKLLNNLKDIGFEAKNSKYALDLYEIIFELIGIDTVANKDELKKWYFTYLDRICRNPKSKQAEGLAHMTIELFYELRRK